MDDPKQDDPPTLTPTPTLPLPLPLTRRLPLGLGLHALVALACLNLVPTALLEPYP